MACDHIIVDGFVPDLATSLGQCRVTVAPLRYGAGIKGKIASSLSYGIPCVATTLASEGMGLKEGDGVVVADTSAAFADTLVHLYTNRNYWHRISDGGLAFVRTNYSYAGVRAQLKAILEGMGLPVRIRK